MLKRDQTYQILLKRIGSGFWKPGEKLPAEPLLCRELGVARVTLRAAMEQLAEEGFLSRSRPAGTIVTVPDEYRKKILVVTNSDDGGTPEISRPDLYIIPGIERRCMELNIETESMSGVFLPAGLPENYLGVIALASNFNGGEALLAKLRALDVPVVNAHAFPRDPGVTGLPSVVLDFRPAFLAGLSHLVLMGHRKIGFIMRDRELVGRRFGVSRREFARKLRDAGVEFDERLVIEVPQCDADFSEQLHDLLFSADPPSALYAYSDFFALRCYEMLKKWGIRIPEEIAVMGFSGYSSAALQSPPLSTVDFGYARIGRIAVDMLQNRDQWYGRSIPVVHSPYEVIPRRSTDFFRMNFDKTQTP